MINRRNFLTGIVSAAAGSQLIVEASNEDIQRFANAKNVSVIRPDHPETVLSGHLMFSPISPGQILYDRDGFPVGIVDEVHMHRNDDFQNFAKRDSFLCEARIHCFVSSLEEGYERVNFKA